MAVRTLTYRDLTPEQRTKGARKTRERLLGLLNNPFLSVEQRQAVFDKIGNLMRWEKLQLEDLTVPMRMPSLPGAPAPVAALPARTPQHHDVVVEEGVSTDEKVS
jgi:hypothetical protein